jgi:predicted nucleic acid-binding protein
MRLVVDASTLVAEVLRVRGQALLAHPSLDLFIAADAWSETEHEVRRRVSLLVDHGQLDPTLAARLLENALTTVTSRVTFLPSDVALDHLAEARWRVPRDPNDVPTMALALALECGIWTHDHDFFGCGVPVWITETLQHALAAYPGDEPVDR